MNDCTQALSPQAPSFSYSYKCSYVVWAITLITISQIPIPSHKNMFTLESCMNTFIHHNNVGALNYRMKFIWNLIKLVSIYSQ